MNGKFLRFSQTKSPPLDVLPHLRCSSIWNESTSRRSAEWTWTPQPLLRLGRHQRTSAAIGGEYLSVKSAGNLSTLFDVGGIIGGILAGCISDQLNARATTAATLMYLAIPSLYIYNKFGGISKTVNIALMMITGLFVNGPYALITTAVSADLGTHKSLKADSRALATVTAIIDGTGSVGAAAGPLVTGFLSTKGWSSVFMMLMFGAFVAGALLLDLVREEILRLTRRCRQQETEGASASTPFLRTEGG